MTKESIIVILSLCLVATLETADNPITLNKQAASASKYKKELPQGYMWAPSGIAQLLKQDKKALAQQIVQLHQQIAYNQDENDLRIKQLESRKSDLKVRLKKATEQSRQTSEQLRSLLRFSQITTSASNNSDKSIPSLSGAEESSSPHYLQAISGSFSESDNEGGNGDEAEKHNHN